MAIPLSILVPLYALGCFIFYRILASFLRTHHNARRARELKCLPPPSMKTKLPFGVDLVQRALAADKAKEFPVEMQRRMEEVGALTYYYGALGSRNIFTADEKNIQALLATQFKDFDLGPKRRRNFLPLLGNGIFTQDGSAWEHSRAMMRPQFARDQVSDLDLEEQHVQNLMRAIVPRGDGWTDTLDMQVLFFRLTLDSATEFLFGESVDSQLAALPGYDKAASLDPTKDEKVFAQAFDKGQMYLATRSRLQGNYWLYHPRDFDKVCGECHAFIDRFVRLALSKNLPEKGSAIATKTGEKTGAKEKYVFLDALAAETRDPVELRSQMLNILLAGRDTTASLIGWVFYCLARDPARYAKLRAIVVEQFGTFSAPHEITFAKLKACQYLQHVNSEALRLYPVVPVNSRMANRDTTLPRGGGPDGKSPVFVPKGTPCDYSVYVMHRRKDIWGPDAELFVPERWEKRKVGWDFLPFNGGPRICIGQQFALTEASYVIVRLLQRFDAMQNMDPDHVVQHNLTLTSCSGAGVKVKLHAAAE